MIETILFLSGVAVTSLLNIVVLCQQKSCMNELDRLVSRLETRDRFIKLVTQ